MGKHQEQSNLHQLQTSHGSRSQGSSRIFIEGCPVSLRRVRQGITLRCVVVLILSFAVLFTGLLWILPSGSRNRGFDAKASVKLSATVQASFKLEKPVQELLPRIDRLEYDISGEIGAPATKVVVLSMHQLAGSANCSIVVFGVLSDPLNIPIDPVSLIMLKSSFVDIFLQLPNLTLTTTVFGQTSDFQILKFPGGVSVIPKQSVSIWRIPQILFNFSLNNSISEIKENSVEFREQLKDGLHLKPYENIYVQVTNSRGSTIYPLVRVGASVVSDVGSMLPERWKELAQIIMGSPALNLGLDNLVFGKVKSVTLSSFLKGGVEDNPPSPSPSPSPALSSPGPSHQVDPPPLSPSNPPTPYSPCSEAHHPSPPISSSPSPSLPAAPPRFHPSHSHPITGPSASPYPDRRGRSPPQASGPPSSGWRKGNTENLVSPSSSAPNHSSSSAVRLSWKSKIWLLSFSAALLLIHLF